MKPFRALVTGFLAAGLSIGASARAQPVAPSPSGFGGSDPGFLRVDVVLGSIPGGLGSAGLFVVDVDDDGTPEVLAAQSASWLVLGRNASGAWVPRHFHDVRYASQSYYGDADSIVAARPGRFDGGAMQIAVLHESGILEFFDGASGALVATQSAGAAPRAMAVGRLDGGVVDRLAVVNDSTLSVYALGQDTALWTLAGAGGADVAVGNVDADPALEIAIAKGSGNPGIVVDAGTHAIQWTNPLGFGDHLAAGDIDGDGRDEIVSVRSYAYEIDAWDADEKALKWSASTDYYAPAGVRIADADGDGVADVLVATYYTVQVRGGVSGALRATSPFSSYGPVSMDAGELAGDCTRRVLLGGGSLTSFDVASQQSTTIVDPETGPVAFAAGKIDGTAATRLLRVPVTGHPTLLDLASRSAVWSSSTVLTNSYYATAPPLALARENAGALWYVLYGSVNYSPSLMAFDGATNAMMWSQPISPVAIAAGDVDNDGLSEVLAASGSTVTLLNGLSGAPLWTSPNLSGTTIAVALVNTNGVPGAEILAAVSGQGLFAFDGYSHALKWLRSIPKISAFDVGDVDGDGDPDVLIATSDGNLSAYDGISQALLFQTSLGTAINAVRVGDIDGNGVKEIAVVVTTDPTTTSLRILKASDRSTLWDSGPLPGYGIGGSNALLIADADGDGRTEVLVGTNAATLVFESPGAAETTPPVFAGTAGVKAAAALGCCPAIALSWNAATDAASPPVTYRVYRSTQSGFTPAPENLVAETPFLGFRDEHLPKATTFRYVVRAADRLGNEDANTKELSATTASGPVITNPPLRQGACLNTPVAFTVTAAGKAPLTYQWLKDGQALAGKTSATLSIASASQSDEGVYSCRVTENSATCATTESMGAVLEIIVKGGDVNRDCKVDVSDVFVLINYLFAGGPAPLGDPDVNGDEVLDVSDVFYLINYLFAGGAAPAAPQR